ncbi:hypothetical protein D3C75_941950 [compost metagenome]
MVRRTGSGLRMGVRWRSWLRRLMASKYSPGSSKILSACSHRSWVSRFSTPLSPTRLILESTSKSVEPKIFGAMAAYIFCADALIESVSESNCSENESKPSISLSKGLTCLRLRSSISKCLASSCRSHSVELKFFA